MRPGYLERAQKCLDEANGNFARARETFIEQEMKSQNITRKTAENRWAEAMKDAIPRPMKRLFPEILFAGDGRDRKSVHMKETVFRTGKRVPSNANGYFLG